MTLLELPEAIRDKIIPEPNTGCWLWLGRFGGDKCSYALIWIRKGRTSRKAARYIYELFFGPIDRKLVVDHLCRNRWCVNPMHLEPVTQKENVRRGRGLAARNATKTHCLNGHPLSGENLLIYPDRNNRTRRICKVCRDLRASKSRKNHVRSRT